MLRKSMVALLVYFAMVASHAADALPVLRVAGDNWCPYNCLPSAAQRGYLLDLVQKALGKSYTIEYVLLPWTRAVKSVRAGEVDLLLSTTPVATRNIRLSDPLGIDRTCFFVRHDDPWTFKRLADLDSKRIGVIQDYNYDNNGPLDTLLAQYRRQGDQRLELAYGDDALRNNFKKLQLSRMDVVVENAAVGAYAVQQMGLAQSVRQAGCLGGRLITVHVGASPALKNSKEILATLNSTVQQMRTSNELAPLLQRYGVEDWQPLLAATKKLTTSTPTASDK